MSKQSDRRLLAEKYRNGQCTPEEIRRIQSWYDELEDYGFPDQQELDRASEEATIKTLRQIAKLQQKRVLRRVLVQIGAAAAVILLMLNLWLVQDKPKVSSTSLLGVADIQESITTGGEKKKLILPDGSSVTLNTASTIRYPKEFGTEHRQIELDGQAFFDIVSDPDKPFLVSTKDLTVRVLGTSFDVKAYSGEQKAIVRVASGKVEVLPSGTPAQQLALLQPGQQFDYNKSQHLGKTIPVEIKTITDWQHNILHFEFVPLVDICKELERTYGIPIIVENNDILLERYHLNVQDETIDNILLLLSKSGKGFSYESSKGKIIIK
ncbi:MAG: FecR domain-containing protein [Sphingobacterium sp.]|jgi:ferric-dicitrate binding protein FerR (iron transport regulator)|nr:FecR domain-containing protein [Sphingobacterium sp.]